MAWGAGQRGPDRSGEIWGAVLEAWPCAARVSAEAGKGLERGVKLANEAREAEVKSQAAAAVMPMTMGLDVLHTQRELQCVLHSKWKRAERL